MVTYYLEGNNPESIQYLQEESFFYTTVSKPFLIEIRYNIIDIHTRLKKGTNRIQMRIINSSSLSHEWIEEIESYLDFCSGTIHFFSSYKILKEQECILNHEPKNTIHTGKGISGNLTNRIFSIEIFYKDSYPHQITIHPPPDS